MEPTKVRLGFVLTLIVVLTPSACLSQEYLPLSFGSSWHYEGVQGAQERQTVVGTVDVWGMSTRVIQFTESTHNPGLKNYWTTEPDRDVLLWGFNRKGFGWLYNPPIRVLDAPLFIGKTWSTTVQIFSVPDTVLVGTFPFAFTVYEEGVISVPAGSFSAFGIGSTTPLPARYSISGEVARAEPQGSADVWYSEGVGRVRYIADQRYDLESYGQPTPVLSATWGSIKRQFR
jgi:hypothetical protein